MGPPPIPEPLPVDDAPPPIVPAKPPAPPPVKHCDRRDYACFDPLHSTIYDW